jgi:hypothetical protein
MDVPVGQAAGVSHRRTRLWGAVAALLVIVAAAGCVLFPWLVAGTPLHELWGIPYPPILARRTMIPLDYYFLGMLGVGLVFLEWAIVALRASRFPRSDGAGAALLGTALCALGGAVLFARLWAVVHG